MPQDTWSESAKAFYSRKERLAADPRYTAAFAAAYRNLAKKCPGIIRGKVLDLGCGSGFLTLAFKDSFIAGLDISSASLRAAKTLNPERPFILSDMTELPFPDHAFDSVVCLTSVEFCADKRKVLDEIKRVISPNGRVYLEVRNENFILWKFPGYLKKIFEKLGWLSPYEAPGFRDYTDQEWRELLNTAGFHIIRRSKSIRPWNYGSWLTRTKNLIIELIKFAMPISLQYMIGYECGITSKPS